MERSILHCDLNNFFASVAVLKNPTLKNLPLAVCGSEMDRHGIVLAKNEAAKAYGIKTAETIWQAVKKCSDLIIVPPDFSAYENFSKKVINIYRQYSDKVESFGIDECWIDVTGSEILFGSGAEIAYKIKRRVKKETGLTISVGVSFNKVFAKMGSDMKKPDAVTVISKENFKEKIWSLGCDEMLWIGAATAKALKSMGIFTIGDLALADETALTSKLGKNGLMLKKCAMGLDNTPVTVISGDYLPKSIGRLTTGATDLKNNEQVWAVLVGLSEQVAEQLRRYHLCATSIQIHTRTSELEIKEFQGPLGFPTNLAITLASQGMELLKKNYNWEKPLRSIGIRAIQLKDEQNLVCQFDLFGSVQKEMKTETIENRVYELRKRFGRNSVIRGVSLCCQPETDQPGFRKISDTKQADFGSTPKIVVFMVK